jgi:hypothetical protein
MKSTHLQQNPLIYHINASSYEKPTEVTNKSCVENAHDDAVVRGEISKSMKFQLWRNE